MANALDAFEVEGVGHNLPFLSAVMGQQRFRDGRLTTGYIAEEFPEGFAGATLDDATLERIGAFAAVATHAHEGRGFVGVNGSGLHQFSHERTVVIGAHRWDYAISERHGEHWLLQAGGGRTLVETNWLPGETLARAQVDGQVLVLKVTRSTGGFRIRFRGADLKVAVLLPHVADLLPLMPVKQPPLTPRCRNAENASAGLRSGQEQQGAIGSRYEVRPHN